MTVTSTTTVGQNDVLMGRDKVPHRHEGNKRFRDLVQDFREEYQQAQFRKDKKRIAESIISIVTSSGGRFLKHVSDEQGWCEVSDADRYEKVCHALRSAKRRSSLRSSSFASLDTNRSSIGSPNSEDQGQQEEVEAEQSKLKPVSVDNLKHDVAQENAQQQEEEKAAPTFSEHQAFLDEPRLLRGFEGLEEEGEETTATNRLHRFPLMDEHGLLQNMEEAAAASEISGTPNDERSEDIQATFDDGADNNSFDDDEAGMDDEAVMDNVGGDDVDLQHVLGDLMLNKET